MALNRIKITEQGGISQETQSDIEQAAAAYDWETFCTLVADRLGTSGLSSAEEYALRDRRALANDYLFRPADKVHDLRKMVVLAEEDGDTLKLISALNKLAYALAENWAYEEALATAGTALRLARDLGEKGLEADVLVTVGQNARGQFQLHRAIENFEQAIAVARECGREDIEAAALCHLGFIFALDDQFEQAKAVLHEARAMAQALGDTVTLAETINNLGVASTDLADTLAYDRQARKLARQIHHRRLESYAANNLAIDYGQLGLYRRALFLAREALRLRILAPAANVHDSIAFIALEFGDLKLARESFETILSQTDMESPLFFEVGAELGLGLVDYHQSRFADAVTRIEKAIVKIEAAGLSRGLSREVILARTWLAAALLAQGEIPRAVALSKLAADAIPSDGTLLWEHNLLLYVWWWRYQALKALEAEQHSADDASWQALEQARELMFKAVASIGDEGLRRSYLNKVNVNRAISEAWAAEAHRRGLPLTPFTDRETTPAALAAQLERIVESGTRFASERDTSELADFILQEFVELSGVDRAFVITRVGALREAPLHWAATDGIDGEDRQSAAAFAGPFIKQAVESRTPLLFDTVGELPEGAIPELHRRSALALPMMSQGKVLGVLYGDMRHLFGRLNENDRNVLGLLANQAGAALENANWVETLEQQVAERTAEVEAANQAKSAFISNMSHELRTPLNAIIGFTRIVKRKTRDQIAEKQQDNLGKVQSSAEHLLGLINTILDIAKIESGNVEVINSQFQVDALIAACIGTAQPLLRPGVELLADVPANLPDMISDQDKLKQILLNLLSNAAKFTHEGSITLQVRQQDGLLLYEVIDSGIGMTEEQLARVFEEFQQAESTTSRDYGGTGLGLPISKQLAQLLGGDLVAASIEGEGTTFTLSIPIRLH